MKRVVIIGLGIFGFNLSKELFDHGFEVLAIDKNQDVVNRIRDYCSKAVIADGREKDVLESLGIQPDDVVVISFGEDLAASTLVTLHLKELAVKEIIVKVPNEDHQRILERVGATRVIIPEREMASRIARNLISPNVLDYLPVSEDFTICEVAPPSGFLGKSISDLRLREKFHIEVIAIRDVLSDRIQLVPEADFVIKDSDVLIVLGREENINKATDRPTR
jgi:trk system potassium uptake protein TrkA